jgi:hypothetical protein
MVVDTGKSVKTEEAWIAMHGRILRCPLGNNPKDCPLHEIRKLPVEERLTWLNSKTSEEVQQLFRQHLECLACKTGISSARFTDPE